MKNKRSPINYIGNKNKLINEIRESAPSNISTMYDVFGGSGVVSFNIEANRHIINDINTHIVTLLDHLKCITEEEIDIVIRRYDLSKTNRDGFIALRDDYNSLDTTHLTREMSILLYTLLCFSYNNQYRFNNSMKYNSSFGLNRSDFNQRLRERLNEYHIIHKENNISFTNLDYEPFINDIILGTGDKDSFVYLDPPYLITTGNYNDGKRGYGMWNKEDDAKLFELMDMLNENGIKFMLSNVTHHKGNVNEELLEFSRRYNVREVKVDYSNASYNTKDTSNLKTREVLIMNY